MIGVLSCVFVSCGDNRILRGFERRFMGGLGGSRCG